MFFSSSHMRTSCTYSAYMHMEPLFGVASVKLRCNPEKQKAARLNLFKIQHLAAHIDYLTKCEKNVRRAMSV